MVSDSFIRINPTGETDAGVHIALHGAGAVQDRSRGLAVIVVFIISLAAAKLKPLEKGILDLMHQAAGFARKPFFKSAIGEPNVGESTPFAPVIPLTADSCYADSKDHLCLHTNCLQAESYVLCEHMMLVHKSNLVRCIGRVEDLREQIALYVALGRHMNLLPASALSARSRCGRKSILPDSALNVLRRWKTLTRRELAEKTGVDLRAIECFEKGRRSMAMNNVLQLARCFGVSATGLLNNDFTELERMGVEA